MNTSAVNWTKGQYNPAGVTEVWYAVPEDVLTFPALADPSTATTFSSLVTYAEAIVMQTGKQFWPLYCTLETGEVKCTLAGARDGKGYENQVDLSFPGGGTDGNFSGFKAWVANRDIILIVREKNGVLRVLGDLENTANLDADAEISGAKISDARSSKLTFKTSGPTPCPIYSMTIDSLLTPAA